MFKHKIAIAFLAIGFFIGMRHNTIVVNADSLEKVVSEQTGLDEEYVRYLYNIALNNDNYIDKFFSVDRDTVIESNGPVLKLGSTKYQVLESINTTGIIRPSEYFMPDSMYSVAYDIKTLMQYRYYKNRGGYQRFFDSFNDDIKQSIVFCEAILEYIGEDSLAIDKFTRAYEMYLVGHAHSIEEALRLNGITDQKSIAYVVEIFDMNKKLSGYTNIEDTRDIYEMPYLLGYTSRENLLEAAFSLVGKVRYTWAGGHARTSNIKGINPVWSRWEQLYSKTEGETGYSTCIKPSYTWCPIHGYNEDERCIAYDMVNNWDDYLALRIDKFGWEDLSDAKYSNMLDYIDAEDGTAHRLDGLDCSGYASWIFNQIQNKYCIDSSAMYFTRQQGIESIQFGSELLPGDIFAWTSHIVIIVGKVKDNSKVYVTVEQTPNVLKFGTIYYSGYSQADLDYAMQIAREANQLIGNTTEEPHSYCMNNVGHYSVELVDGQDASNLLGNVQSIETKEIVPETEEHNNEGDIDNDDTVEPETQTVTTVKAQYIDIGRYTDNYLDANISIESKDRSIESLTALDIIQYILTKMPMQYVSGYGTYSSQLFDKASVAIDVGTTIIRE